MLQPSSSIEKNHNEPRNTNFRKNKNKKSKEKKTPTEKVEVVTVDPFIKQSCEEPLVRTSDFKDFPCLPSFRRQPWQEDGSNKSGVCNKSWRSVVDSRKNIDNGFPGLKSSAIQSETEKCFNDNENKEGMKFFQKKTSGAETVKTDIKVNAVQVENKTQDLKKNVPVKSKAVIQPKQNTKKKKRSEPIFINLKEILNVEKNRKKEKQHKALRHKFDRQNNREFLSGNILDASNPKRCKGKHREIKKKKLTNLKLAIIKERIIKQKAKEKSVAAYFGKEVVDLIEEIDFKVEIKKYLEELSKRKVKLAESKKSCLQENTSVNCSSVKINENKETCSRVETKLTEDKESKSQKTSSTGGSNCIAVKNKEIKFSSKLREYCDNIPTPALNGAVAELIKELVNLQDKMFARDPIKAKVRKRHVSGFKEVKKHLTLKKVKMIVIAPNLEKSHLNGGVYDVVEELKSIAKNQAVPYVFALDRYKLGVCTKKYVPVSAFAVLNYEGLEARFESVLQYLEEAKNQFAEMAPTIKTEKKEENTDVTSQIIASFISAFNEGVSISENKDSLELH